MGRDSNYDGLADGYIKSYSNVGEEWFFVETEKCQVITVPGNYLESFVSPGVEDEEFIPCSPNTQYTASAYVKGENTYGSNGPRVLIRWYDADKTYITGLGSSPSLATDWARISITLTSPSNAAFMRIKPDFRADPGYDGGTGWYKNLQLQEGATVTEYEEVEFFSLELQDSSASNNYKRPWSFTNDRPDTGSRALTVADQSPDNTWRINTTSTNQEGAQAAIRMYVPGNAEEVKIKVRVRTNENIPQWGVSLEVVEILERLNTDDWISDGTYQTVILDGIRGLNTLELRYYENRGQAAPTNQSDFAIDSVEISWVEVDPTPSPTPSDKKVVQALSFEPDEENPFFTITNPAVGRNYPWTNSSRSRNSGYWGLSSAENKGKASIGQTIGFSVAFKIPITAIDPGLRFFVAKDSGDPLKIFVNGIEYDIEQPDTDGMYVYREVSIPLVPGIDHVVEFVHEKDGSDYSVDGTFGMYIDDIEVSYDTPEVPFYYIGTPSITTIQTTSRNRTYSEGFESNNFNKFFTIRSPGRLISGGGPSKYPERGWGRERLLGSLNNAWNGKPSISGYMYRAIRKGSKNEEDIGFDLIFKVPAGVDNPKIEFWNICELERSFRGIKGAKYPTLYEEYRIWINGSLWKEFNHCSPDLTKSVKYSVGNSGDQANDYACPWGKWWKETISLTAGKTYTISFELQRDAGDSSPIHGRDLLAIDDVKVTWTESNGRLEVTPAQVLFPLDGSTGYKALRGRVGADMPPIEHAEYEAYGQAGSVHQFSNVKPRNIDQPILITGEDFIDARKKVRALSSYLNQDISMGIIYPEGEHRIINGRYLQGLESEERSGTDDWRRFQLTLRAFNPFWYSNPVSLGTDTKLTSFVITNDGDEKAYPIIRVYGSAGSGFKVQLRDPESKEVISSFTINQTLTASQFIIVDTRPGKKTVIRDSNASWYQYLAGDLFGIPKGSWEIFLSSSGTDSDTKMEIDYQIPYFSA